MIIKESEMSDYKKKYSDKGFWKKVMSVCKAAGRKVIETALVLYYCLQDSDTPVWAKSVIIAALGYFISPIDAIPDFLPGGYVDDIGGRLAALSTISGCIKKEHRSSAKQRLEQWF
jgi:uncharacterized membrane protein YkvA (DUF1232 family)